MGTGSDWYKRFRDGIEFIDKNGKRQDKKDFINKKLKEKQNGTQKPRK